MTLTLEQLKDAARELPPFEREELVQFLLHSLSDRDEADVHAQWVALAQDRMAEIRAGKVEGIPAEEVMKTLLEPRS